MSVRLVPPIHRRPTRDGVMTLYSSRYRQTFGSTAGAATEARWVYLETSGVAERLAQGKPTRVLEVGFGTGLNFLVTAAAATRHRTPLTYVALEQTWLPSELVQSLRIQRVIRDEYLLRAWCHWHAEQRVLPNSRAVTFRYPPLIELTIRLGDATHIKLPETAFDAVYQDAFSPDANPELWTANFLSKLATALSPDGVLTSYCVQGEVRRRLAAAGMIVQRRPGPPGGKREILRATVACPQNRHSR